MMRKQTKLQINNKQAGVVFSDKDKQKDNRQLITEYDRRISDLLHRIEFTDATPGQAYKLYMKLQMFLRKRRAVKPVSGHKYTPRTETGNYIINGKITNRKRDFKDGDR